MRLAAHEVRKFRELWADLSLPLYEVAHQFAMHPDTARNHAKRLGLPLRPRRRVGPVEEAHAMWQRGDTVASIADHFGRSPRMVLKWARKYDWPPRQTGRPRAECRPDWATGAAMWLAGASSIEIAARLEVHPGTVRRHAMAHGWPMRKPATPGPVPTLYRCRCGGRCETPDGHAECRRAA